MICNHCKNEIPDNLEFCPFCGETLEAKHQDVAQEPIRQEEEVKEQHHDAHPEPEQEALTQSEEVIAETHDAADENARLEGMIDRTDAPEEVKEDAKRKMKQVEEHRKTRKPVPSPAVDSSPEEEAIEEDLKQEEPKPEKETTKNETGEMSVEQLLASQAARGEITIERMMEVLAALKGQSAPESDKYQSQKMGVPETEKNDDSDAQEEKSEPDADEKESEEVKEAPKKKGLFKKKEKTQEEIAAENLEKTDFYQNTQPLVNDPLPPSPWIKVAKIVLFVILVIILALCAIYFL